MGNGGILGKRNSPSRSRASGVWGLHDLYLNSMHQDWPSGTFNVEVGSFTKQAGTGNQDITIATDLTTAPSGSWAIIFWTSGSQGASGTWTNAYFSPMLGFVANGGGSISEHSVSATSLDNSATSDSVRRMAAKAITMHWVDGSSTDEASFVGFTSKTTMRINWSSAGAAFTSTINYAIISGLSNAKVVNWTAPTAPGSKAVTGVGFSPDLVLHANAGNNVGSVPSSLTSAWMTFGAMNKHGQQWANGFASLDGTSPTNTSRGQQTDACFYQPYWGEGANGEAHFSSMDADGFTVYFSSVSSYPYQIISLCFDGVSSKIGAFTKTTAAAPTAQTVDSRQGFTPKGVLFSGIQQAPAGSPVAGAYWHLGATDLTNERTAEIEDEDAVATTNANSRWHNDKVIARSYQGNTGAKADLSSVGTDSFSLSWTSNDSNADEILYLLLGDSSTDTYPEHVVMGSDIGATATAYSNQKRTVELSEGTLVSVVTTTGNAGAFWYKPVGGVWTTYAAAIAGFSNGSIDAYVDSGGTERLVAAWKQTGTGGGRTDGKLYVMVGAFSSDRSTLTWGTALAHTADVTDPTLDYPDLVAFAEGTGGRAFVVFSGIGNATRNFTFSTQFSISSGGVPAQSTHEQISPGSPGYGVLVHTFPSVDYDPSTKRIFVAWSAGTTGLGKGIRFRTASYSAGSWTWATEVEVDTGHYLAGPEYFCIVRWDGTRAMIGALGYTGSQATLRQYESTNFTSFTPTTLVTNANSEPHYYGSFAVDAATGDTYFWGGGASSPRTLRYRKWTRSVASLGTYTALDQLGGDTPYVNAFPITGGIGWIYTRGNNSPYSVVYDRLELS